MAGDICLVRDPIFLKHDPGFPHPENPERLRPLFRRLETDSVLRALPVLAPRAAEQGALLRLHSREMVAKLMATRGKRGWLDADTYYTPDTAETAMAAAGASIELALAIWRGRFRRGFSFVRPPGHHATRDEAMGFCHLNHVALAVAGVLAEAPRARLAVVDFDLHHGNGTQWAFYDNPNVLFLSSHRYPYYPGTGALEEVGVGKGKGTNVNFPVGEPQGDAFFISLYHRVVQPILNAFAPEMIFVSAGFDGHFLDPMQGLRMQTATYASMADLLLASAEARGGKILFLLEGGYHPEALAESAVAVLERLIEAPRKPFEPAVEADESGTARIEPYLAFHSQYFPEIG